MKTLYVETEQLRAIPIEWRDMTAIIERAIQCLDRGDYSQPIKPYLRYGDLKNRIIAMPAYIGGSFHTAGIKWIASFPDNIWKEKPRAHSVLILNDADNGEPFAVLNSALPSIVRTAAVSGVIIDRYVQNRANMSYTVGIIGWGPIGRQHAEMCFSLLREKLNKLILYDIKTISGETIPEQWRQKTQIASDWREVYLSSDIFITCTVSDERYINLPARPGSLLLNVSLRDYTDKIFDSVKSGILVDDWTEVCRENTDIALFHQTCGLERKHVKTITDVVCRNILSSFPLDQPIMFNPMGMAVFDIAVGCYYDRKLREILKSSS